jgi:hypothetical protein
MRNLLIKLAAGAVGGIAGTYLLGRTLPLSERLPKRLRPHTPRKDPGHFMVQQGERIIGALSPKMHRRAVQGVHLAYGVSWPLGLAALSGVLGLRSAPRTICAGALLGTLVWIIGYEGWLPALGLATPAHRVPLGKNAAGLMSHVAYGAVAALPLALAGPRLQS